jgi:hypothetical protein
MAKLHLFFAVAVLTMVNLWTDTTWGRGFGGMHMGGMHMGGMPMGGMHMGGMPMRRPMGSMPGAGMRGAGYGGAGYGGVGYGGVGPHRGGAQYGGIQPGSRSYASPRSGGAQFGGNRRGGSNVSGRGNLSQHEAAFGPNRLNFLSGTNAGRPGGLGVGRQGFPGAAAGGFLGNSKERGTAGGFRKPGAGNLGREANRNQLPNRKQLGNFLGLPSDGGLHAAGAHRPNRDHLGRDHRGLSRRPAADLVRHGDLVRRNFRGRGFYSAGWYSRYPGAWFPGRWAYGTVWAAMTWDYLNGWFDYDNVDPIYYDYGNTVIYQDDSVTVDGQDVGTPDEYYQQADELASIGAQAQTEDDQEKWLPLGVFALSHDQQTKANLILQLAVNKQGILRGNYTATMTNDTKPVQGSVDKKTQRAAWTIGDNQENIIETGIYNLTKDQAPCLVHFGKNKTEQWLLVRIKQDQSAAESQPSNDPKS